MISQSRAIDHSASYSLLFNIQPALTLVMRFAFYAETISVFLVVELMGKKKDEMIICPSVKGGMVDKGLCVKQIIRFVAVS